MVQYLDKRQKYISSHLKNSDLSLVAVGIYAEWYHLSEWLNTETLVFSRIFLRLMKP